MNQDRMKLNFFFNNQKTVFAAIMYTQQFESRKSVSICGFGKNIKFYQIVFFAKKIASKTSFQSMAGCVYEINITQDVS